MRLRHRIFLSYSREDKEQVESLYRRLIKAGYRPWMDSKDLLPGQIWARTIEEAIRGADFFLTCLSSNSVNKRGFLQREIRIALDMLNELLEEDIYLIPVRLDDCIPPKHLRELQWVDLFEDDGWNRLNEALRSGMQSRMAGGRQETRHNVGSWGKSRHGSASFEPELVPIPTGNFLMGSAEDHIQNIVAEGFDEKWAAWERPQHDVELSEYSIGRYTVTKSEYQRFLEESDYQMPKDWEESQYLDGKEDHPVVNVSWVDATAYCGWLSEKCDKRYQLPTEAQWEKAARGTDGRIYPWGDSFDPNHLNSIESGRGGTSPAGLFSPYGDSPYGVSDMAGGVWEWCLGWFDPQVYQERSAHAVRDPSGPAEGKYRVLRGGAFHRPRNEVRCAVRVRRDRHLRDHLVGFRVALLAADSE